MNSETKPRYAPDTARRFTLSAAKFSGLTLNNLWTKDRWLLLNPTPTGRARLKSTIMLATRAIPLTKVKDGVT